MIFPTNTVIIIDMTKRFYRPYFLLLLCAFFTSCQSYKQFQYITEEFQIPSKIFQAGYNQSWQAVLQVMQGYDMALKDQEAGIIKTRWIDNTVELNFADSFGGTNSIKAAKFKLIINVSKGFRATREVSKISIFKRQLIEQDFLQGWKEIPTDSIIENTILYRIERAIIIDNRLKLIEEQGQKEIEENF